MDVVATVAAAVVTGFAEGLPRVVTTVVDGSEDQQIEDQERAADGDCEAESSGVRETRLELWVGVKVFQKAGHTAGVDDDPIRGVQGAGRGRGRLLGGGRRGGWGR